MKEIFKTNEIKKEAKIETLKGPKESEISYCPEIGGTITSIKVRGIEILRRDPNDLKGEKKRGGIPIMFPNGGPLDNVLPGATEKLEQHGFVSRSELSVDETNEDENKLIEKFEGTKSASYPYEKYLLRIISEIEEDGSVLLTEEVQNNSDKEMPISMGLHPYFRVPKGRKNEAEIDFGDDALNREIKKNSKSWMNGEAMIIDNPKLKSENTDEDKTLKIKIRIPEVGTIAMDVFEEYESIWIWSKESEKGDEDDFICVEPVMRKPRGLTSERPGIVKPHDTFRGSVKFGLEKEPSSEGDMNNQS